MEPRALILLCVVIEFRVEWGRGWPWVWCYFQIKLGGSTCGSHAHHGKRHCEAPEKRVKSPIQRESSFEAEEEEEKSTDSLERNCRTVGRRGKRGIEITKSQQLGEPQNTCAESIEYHPFSPITKTSFMSSVRAASGLLSTWASCFRWKSEEAYKDALHGPFFPSTAPIKQDSAPTSWSWSTK